MATQHFCEDQAVANDSADHAYELDAAVRVFDRGGIFVALDVGAGVESVVLRMELSMDGTTWYRASVYDPSASAYAASVTATADTQTLLFWLDNYAQYARLVANNSGANAATLTAYMVPV